VQGGWNPDRMEACIRADVTGEKGARLLGRWVLPAGQDFE